jgi:hypothetical protein
MDNNTVTSDILVVDDINMIKKKSSKISADKNLYMKQYRQKNNEKMKDRDLSYYYKRKYNITNDQYDKYKEYFSYVIKMKNLFDVMDKKCPDILFNLMMTNLIEKNNTGKIIDKLVGRLLVCLK